MSRILRRPMFRGGSTNEGIMSVPRKQYEIGSDEGGVQGFNLSNYGYPYDQSNEENQYTQTSSSTNDSIDLNKINNLAKTTAKEKNITSDKLKELSASDILMAEYLGNRPDPLGKFLIQFGLNYMSARPKSGKFGALATAAESAKKPTEQLYSDIDTDRLLKLKLMTALGKSESKVALEKEARLLVEQYPERYPDMKTALAELMRIKTEKKTLTPEERVAAREKSFELDQPLVKRAKAEIFELGLPKLGKERKNVDLNNAFIDQGQLVQKPNSTDAQLVKPPQNIEKSYKVGKIYIDLESRNAYKYTGPNTFRFVQSLE